MMFGKPHLVKHRTGTPPIGYDTGKLQAFFRHHVEGSVLQQRRQRLIPPVIPVDKKLFEPGFMSPQKILRVIDANRVFGSNGVYDGGAARTGEMRQPIPQTISRVSKAIADKSFVQHTRFQWVFGVCSFGSGLFRINIIGHEKPQIMVAGIKFDILVTLDLEPEAKEIVAVGDLGFWPMGSAFCIFFGPTPVSQNHEPRAYSPVNVFGKILGDAQVFRQISSGSSIRVVTT